MYVDLRDCPLNKSSAEFLAMKTSVYVKVAQSVERNGTRVFRMIIDPDISKTQLASLLYLTVRDQHGIYNFAWLEPLSAPVVDNVDHRSEHSLYLRVTYS